MQLTPASFDLQVDVESEVVTWAPDDLVSLIWVSLVLALFVLLFVVRRFCSSSGWWLRSASGDRAGAGGDGGVDVAAAYASAVRWLRAVRRLSDRVRRCCSSSKRSCYGTCCR